MCEGVCGCARVFELGEDIGGKGIVTNDVTDSPNVLTDGQIEKNGRGDRRVAGERGEFKTAAESRIQMVLKTAGSRCGCLSFQSEEGEKDCVRRIGQEERSSRGAIGHLYLSSPKEMAQREGEEGLEVGWETQMDVPTDL